VPEEVKLDVEAWEQHAQWWDGEAQRVRQKYAADEAKLAHAASAFGKIGSSTVGAAMQETLLARAGAGEDLGAYAAGVAAHIRANLRAYVEAEEANRRALST